MLEVLVNIVPKSEAAALVRMGKPTAATYAGQPGVRFPSEVLTPLKGLDAGARSVDVLMSEGAAMELGAGGREALVFLQREGAGYRLVRHSEPVEVPERERDAYLEAVRGWIQVTAPNASPAELRKYVVRMLESRLAFFQLDASRAALDLEGFDAAGIESMIALVEGSRERAPASGNLRENLIAVIFRDGPPERLVELGRELLPGGEHREIYQGLAARDGAQAETIDRAFLQDPKEKIQIGGVLIAGLLRRADLIDAFEKGVRGQPSAALRAALDQARAYVKREL